MEKIRAVYDITLTLGGEAIDYPEPDIPNYSREEFWKLEEGKIANVSKLVMTTHHGTHVDAPFHVIPGGKKLDEFPIERWVCPAHVIRIKDKTAIRPAELENLDIRRGDALLFKTHNSISGLITKGGEKAKVWVYLSIEAAEFCVEKKVGLIGIDYYSIELSDDPTCLVHRKILGNDILILEAINLADVPVGEYVLCCLPLKLKGADGAPARAVLIR